MTQDHKVIETKSKPTTFSGLVKLGNVFANEGRKVQRKDVIKELILDLARTKLGLVPQEVTGAGHVHTDIESAFLENPVMFRCSSTS